MILPGISNLHVTINSPHVRLTALSSLSLLSLLEVSGEQAAGSAVQKTLSMLHQLPLLKVACFQSILQVTHIFNKQPSVMSLCDLLAMPSHV